MREKVLVAFSGGVDSTAAALLLQKAGYDVKLISFMLTDTGDAASEIAGKIDLSIELIDLRSEFRTQVIDAMVEEYALGRTPNPCVLCNPRIKWKYLIKYADEFGIEKISTGHYSRTLVKNGHVFLARGIEDIRDQSYFMYRLSEDILKRVIFPLDNYDRPMSEELVHSAGLEPEKSHRSRDLCFLDNKLSDFLAENIKFSEGNVFLDDGTFLGKHKAIQTLTVGQRKGVGITYPVPLYVMSVDVQNRRVIVGTSKSRNTTRFGIYDVSWINYEPELPLHSIVRVRNTHKGTNSILIKQNGEYFVELEEPANAITPGQSAVFYKDGIILGGGYIKRLESF